MSLRKVMKSSPVEVDHVEPLSEPADGSAGESQRIMVRLSMENYEYLLAEAGRTGTTMSALASLAVADWIDERKASKAKALTQEELVKFLESQGHHVNVQKSIIKKK